MIIGDRFQLNNKINSGSFGEIHLAVDLKTKQTVAVKMEPLACKHPQLQYQAKLLAYLTDQLDPRSIGLPRLYYYGKFDRHHVMIMDLLGPSLEQLFQKCNKKFDLKTVVMIGIQIIQRLKYLHKKKFIHRDIKPENFLLGMNQHCATVFMIDLGLSKKYIQKNGQHIPYRDDRSLKGTPRYTSLNSHLGIQQSRRDDLESVIYMLIYFLKGQLPWQNLKQDANYDRYEKILQKKLSVSVQNLCAGIPHQFIELVEYTRGLHFIQQPNYELIKNLLQQTLEETGEKIVPNDLYCWQKSENQNVQEKPKVVKLAQKQPENNFGDFGDFNSNKFNSNTFNQQKNIQQQNIQKAERRDSLFDNSRQHEPENNQEFNPFDTNFEKFGSNQVKNAKRDDSMDFNPFDQSKRKNTEEDDMFGAFGHKKDSLNKSEDGFPVAKPSKNESDYDPFGNGFEDFENRQSQKRQKTKKNESFDDPFGDPDIVEL